MRKTRPVSSRHIVKDYNIDKPKENRYYFKTNLQFLNTGHNWGYFRALFNLEFNKILNNKITITHQNSKDQTNRDVLFEYLVIKGVTILEIGLKICCRNYVKMFPDRAKKLLYTVNPDKDITIQILSNYSFSNLSDIEHVFSTFWGKKYFQVLRHRSEESHSSLGYEPERPKRAGHLFKNMGMFKDLIKLRNELIHENKPIQMKSKVARKNLLATVYDVIYHTHEEQHNFPYDGNEFDEIHPIY